MACPDAITSSDAITAALAGPQKVSGDAGSVEQYSLESLIAADKYIASKCAATSKRQGLRFTRLIPDGTVRSCSGNTDFNTLDGWYR